MTILQIDPMEWRDNVDRAPFRIRHNLLDDERMTAESLALLSERLPATAIEHNYGELPALHFEAAAPRTEAAPAEILRADDFLQSWMVIKNVEQDPAYRELLTSCLAEVAAIPGVDLPQRNHQGFIFASSHGAVTPSHTDPEENFLLQLRGTKEITIGSWPDAQSKQRELERKQLGGHRSIPFLPAEPRTFRLEPGDGVYVPPNAPHYVEVFDKPSISFSVTFRTPETDVFENVVYLNSRLRRLGLNPRSPGQSESIDQIKSIVTRASRRATRWRNQ